MNGQIPQPTQVDIEFARTRLLTAIEKDRSPLWCLRLWSKYIKVRDGYRCVCCDAFEKGLQSHHVIRKSLFPWGAFELGNGITLCRSCHGKVHAEFNGRPTLALPLNAESGDDQDEWAFLFGLLHEDAQERQLDQDHFYFIGDHMLKFFMRCQGYESLYDAAINGKISRISYAHHVWTSMPELWYSNVTTGIFRNTLPKSGGTNDG